MSTTMQAIQVVRVGEPLEMHTVPVPKPKKGEVLLKQHYSSINPMDEKV
jgi:NADPH:quinone reductase-like Zn-dependent oxidoreductase